MALLPPKVAPDARREIERRLAEMPDPERLRIVRQARAESLRGWRPAVGGLVAGAMLLAAAVESYTHAAQKFWNSTAGMLVGVVSGLAILLFSVISPRRQYWQRLERDLQS